MSRIERPFHGGESYRLAVRRHWRLFDELALRRAGERVLLIGHGATYAALEHLCSGLSLHEAVRALNAREWEPLRTYEYDAAVAARQAEPA